MSRSSTRILPVDSNANVREPSSMPMARRTAVSISRWINERYPPLQDLLSAHDVARLTRRPRWMIVGLSLIGRFPKKLKFRGRAIGWRRSEVLEWMLRDLAVASDRAVASPSRRRRRPRQVSFQFQRAASVSLARRNRARSSGANGMAPPIAKR